MATRTFPEEPPGDVTAAPTTEDDLDDDFSFSSSAEEKPKTGRELYEALVANGLIGAWKDRTDIGDTLEYVQRLKDEGRARRQARLWDTPHIDKEDFMAAQKHVSEETHEEKVTDEEITDEDAWEFPSSSPDKKILTGRALLESGLVGLWKDRTDIGDTLEYVQKLKDQGRRRRQKRIRKYLPS